MLLPQREGWRRIGTLDFQDGGIGSIAYDLASLCEVVRRDGGDALLDDVLNVYRQETQTDLSPEDLKRAAVVLSAQRHTRILGIIARLALGGRSDKLPYLAHVQAYLKKLLQHPALSPVEKLGFL